MNLPIYVLPAGTVLQYWSIIVLLFHYSTNDVRYQVPTRVCISLPLFLPAKQVFNLVLPTWQIEDVKRFWSVLPSNRRILQPPHLLKHHLLYFLFSGRNKNRTQFVLSCMQMRSAYCSAHSSFVLFICVEIVAHILSLFFIFFFLRFLKNMVPVRLGN